jgi:vacuolar protein sorting-associated protein 13A/C
MDKCEEIKMGDSFLLLNVLRDPMNDKRTLFSIEPPYRIKNCLPKTLLLQLINHK